MDVTVLISSSPIASHPSTQMIDEVIKSVRDRLPNPRIIVMLDGVRKEQKEYKKNYRKYIDNLDPTVEKVVSLSFRHQAGMTQKALKQVTTPFILFLEHDTPLTKDIPFDHLIEPLKDGRANVVRLNYNFEIHPDHKYLVEGVEGDLTKMWQWSQRPHLSTVEFYRYMLSYFPATSKTMIEDHIYPIIIADREEKHRPWETWKIMMYTPEGDQQRSIHLDGREGKNKYEMLAE
jgi:hypothetical protein